MDTSIIRLGIVAALHPETKSIKKQFAWKSMGESAYYLEKKNAVLFETGVGQKKVEESLPRFLETYSPERLLNIGTAGALDPSLPLFQVMLPQDMVTNTHRVTCDTAWRGKIEMLLQQSDIPYTGGTLFSSEKPVTGERETVKDTMRAAAVDMEAGFILPLAAARGIPCTVIKVISDTAESPGFSNHIGAARDRLREVVARVLEGVCYK